MKLQRPTVLPIDHWDVPDRGYSTMRVTSPWGWRSGSFHGAIDIGNGRLGDRVVAAAAGYVLAAGYLGAPWSEPTSRFPSGNYGGMMAVIEHAPRIVTIYAHLAPAIAVRAGQAIAAGAPVGYVGDTGIAAPPPLGGGGHLHFGVQAPADAVPAGVATAATRYGYGLDVDPWPLINGTALEDPMKLRNPVVTQPWRTITGGRFTRPDGSPGRWADPRERVVSIAELTVNGVDSRILDYGPKHEALIAERAGLEPLQPRIVGSPMTALEELRAAIRRLVG